MSIFGAAAIVVLILMFLLPWSKSGCLFFWQATKQRVDASSYGCGTCSHSTDIDVQMTATLVYSECDTISVMLDTSIYFNWQWQTPITLMDIKSIAAWQGDGLPQRRCANGLWKSFIESATREGEQTSQLDGLVRSTSMKFDTSTSLKDSKCNHSCWCCCRIE